MRSGGWLALVVWAMTGAAMAAEPAQVEYSADETMETAEFSTGGPVYVAAGKERRETVMEGMRQITIMRHDKKLLWTLMPQEQMYMEVKLDTKGASAAPGDLSDFTIEQTTVGEEEVNGIMTTKSKIMMTGKKGEKMGGFWWVSRDGVMVKMDVIGTDSGSKMRMKKELRNLKVGRQDPDLFEIPQGYQKMSMMNMLMGGGQAQGQEEDQAGGGEEAQAPAGEKKKSGFGLKNIMDMVK